MSYEIRVPGTVKIGGGVIAEAPGLLTALGARKPLLVVDGAMVANGTAKKLVDAIEATGCEVTIFAEVRPDPTNVEVERGAALFRAEGHDALISLGGGSAIDTAKAIGVVIGNGGAIREYKTPVSVTQAGPPHLAIPTTAGTGAEVTRFAVVTDTALHEKMLIAGPALMPDAALVDFELTLSMPPRLTADVGIDSLTHAIEAYVSRRANPWSDAMALSAMATIWRALPRAYREPEDREAREAMMGAATMAGMAFSNASVALVHGMSRPLGLHFHIAHGLSNAMLLPAVTRYSLAGAPERYARCAKAMGIASWDSAEQQACEALVEALCRRNEELAVPSPKQYGVNEREYRAAMGVMAEQALASGSPQNNPRVPELHEIVRLYEEVWS